MLTRALRHSVATMRRHLGLALLAWLIGAAIAGIASIPVWFWFGRAAVRPDADGLLQRLDPATVVDLSIANGPLAAMGVITWTLFSICVAVVAGVMLNAGMVAVVVTPDGRPMSARFVAGIRVYFLRFLRLAIFAAITAAVLFVVVIAIAALLGRIFLYGADYTMAAMTTAVAAGAFLVTAGITLTALDYARIQVALTDTRQALRAWLTSLRFVVGHPVATMTLTIAFAAIAGVVLLVYASMATPARSMAAIAMLFVVRQVTVLIRVVARIGLLGAEHELWRTLMPPPPPPLEPAPILTPDPPPVPPGVVEASI